MVTTDDAAAWCMTVTHLIVTESRKACQVLFIVGVVRRMRLFVI